MSDLQNIESILKQMHGQKEVKVSNIKDAHSMVSGFYSALFLACALVGVADRVIDSIDRGTEATRAQTEAIKAQTQSIESKKFYCPTP